MITEKRSETARALEDLHGLREVLLPGSRVANFFASPQVRLADKRQVLRQSFEGTVLPIVTVFIELLLRKKRLGDFPTIVEEFEALVEQALGVRRAHVVSALSLEANETQRLHEALEKYTHSHIKLTSEVDASLLGGALVRIGDRVVDRSVRTLLDSIAQRLHEASV
jgi:F-type H+-transporting ATPase subunit delta